jgi:AraC-like DNA-binding protein
VSISHAPLIALSTGNVVVFWLFTRALFDETFKLRWWHALVWAAVAAFSFVNCMWIAPASGARLSIIAINLIALGFIALAVTQTVASWSSDLVERRRSVRVFIVSAAALYGGLNAALQIVMSGSGSAAIANTVNLAVLAGVVAAICYAMMRVDGVDLFPSAPEVQADTSNAVAVESSAADQKLIDALMRLMGDERIYRHDNFTIGMLATKLGIPEYKLRRLINQRLGYRNFNVFLNEHRIAEAKAALADPSQAEVPVITIAMDAGFQSLGPFNRAFKATTGVTPTEYRRLKATAA